MKLHDIAKKIISFNPDKKIFDHVLVGIDAPLKNSATGITWRDIQKLANLALEKRAK